MNAYDTGTITNFGSITVGTIIYSYKAVDKRNMLRCNCIHPSGVPVRPMGSYNASEGLFQHHGEAKGTLSFKAPDLVLYNDQFCSIYTQLPQ